MARAVHLPYRDDSFRFLRLRHLHRRRTFETFLKFGETGQREGMGGSTEECAEPQHKCCSQKTG